MKNKLKITLLFGIVLLSISCKKKKDPEPDDLTPEIIIRSDFSISIDENPNLGDSLFTFNPTTTNTDNVIYRIISQSVENAFQISNRVGNTMLVVVDRSIKFNYEINKSITAQIELKAWNEEQKKETIKIVTIKVYIRDLPESEIGDFIVGDSWNGGRNGVVFWVDSTDEHGLVCAMSDAREEALKWGCEGTIIGADKLNDGNYNTIMITSNCNDQTTAAYHADKSKWYLPSSEELKKLMSEHNVINTELLNYNNGKKLSKNYWSSTEHNTLYAYYVTQNTIVNTAKKSDTIKVRAIRKF